jgi:alcohol dehydrogenase (cytochrome c)
VWNLSLDNSANASSQPLVIDGTMYVATHSHTMAVDALSGPEKWKVAVEVPADIAGYLCCGIQSRGLAALDGVLYRTTIDAHVAGRLDERRQGAVEAEGRRLQGRLFSMTHAPLIAGGVLITGISGGEYGARGFLDGWDLKTGEKKWRRWTTASPARRAPTPGRVHADTGGAPTWLTGTYDPELDLVYWGVGNGAPWNAALRGGDSLYIGSVLALRPATGEIVWHYQFSPGDPYDYDGTNELVLADLPGSGSGKVLMQANRNGFFYVHRPQQRQAAVGEAVRTQGELGHWHRHGDRPADRHADDGAGAQVRRDRHGGHRGLAERLRRQELDADELRPGAQAGVLQHRRYLGMKVKYVEQKRPGGPNWWLGLELAGFVAPEDGQRGSLVAWDPVAARRSGKCR